MNIPSDLKGSVIRTITPLIAGLIIALTSRWLGLTAGQVTAVATTVASAWWYVAVRVFETWVSPRAGWLLGAKGAPTYKQ